MIETIQIIDDFLAKPGLYRLMALGRQFTEFEVNGETWKGIATLTVDSDPVSMKLKEVIPGIEPRLTFFRKSPRGQHEPHLIHTDEMMGDWIGILYLNPNPPAEDGTAFWRHLPTDTVKGIAYGLSMDPECWERTNVVAAKFNRLVIFDAAYYHSRALECNHGEGQDARLIQVVFGDYGHPAPVLREATLEDVPRLVELARIFRQSTNYQSIIRENVDALTATAARLVAGPDSTVIVATVKDYVVGMIGLLAFPHHASGDRTVSELFFWVQPEHRGCGKQLLAEAEGWARREGATTIQLLCPYDTPEVGSFYFRAGYAPIEIGYSKRV